MKRTFSLLGLAFVATALCVYSCTKEEENKDNGNTPDVVIDDPDPEPEPNNDTLAVDVSQTPTTRSVLIEEFTGNHCGYCPLGHKAANEVVEAYPGKAFVINYHVAGGLASAYTTTPGSVLNSAFNVDGNGRYSIPAGVINRHNFTNDATMLTISYNSYMAAANQVVAMNACANVAAAASIDTNTRELKVKVKVYYTANGTGTSNKLHVALIQNNVLGYQSGSSNNPAQVVGNQYSHNEMFLKFLSRFSYSSLTHTYNAGDNISTITQGSLFEKTYTTTIPESFTDETNNTSEMAVLKDLEVIVFVTEGTQEVINVCKADMRLK